MPASPEDRLRNGEVIRYRDSWGRDVIQLFNNTDRQSLKIQSVPGNPDVTVRITTTGGEPLGTIQVARVQLHNLIAQVTLSDMTSVYGAGRPACDNTVNLSDKLEH